MNKTKHIIGMAILLTVAILSFIALIGCNNTSTYNTSNNAYNINHYIDTINGNIILTTVCDNKYNYGMSCSTLKLN